MLLDVRRGQTTIIEEQEPIPSDPSKTSISKNIQNKLKAKRMEETNKIKKQIDEQYFLKYDNRTVDVNNVTQEYEKMGAFYAGQFLNELKLVENKTD